MADDKLPDSADESDETTPTDPASESETPAELTDSAAIDDPRDTPDDGYIDDPATPDINEAKLDRASDEVAAAEDPVTVSSAPLRVGAGRVRSTAPVRRERAATTESGAQRATPARFVAESVGELRKVVWPTGNQVQQYFIVVLVFVLFIMAIVSLLDLGFGWLILKVFG